MANIELCFRGRLCLSSKREAFFVSSLKAQPSPKLTNNVLGYVHTEQFLNGSGPDQVCSHRTPFYVHTGPVQKWSGTSPLLDQREKISYWYQEVIHLETKMRERRSKKAESID